MANRVDLLAGCHFYLFPLAHIAHPAHKAEQRFLHF